MVVYSPIYLNKYIGFNWSEIGIIIFATLLPFVLFEYPIGKLSDSKYGEKDIMLIGILIMGLSTMLLSITTAKILIVWCILFFVTRVGASMIEIMIETYLFKVIKAQDTEILSSFRVARPASLFFSSGIMIIGLNFLDFRFMFTIIGLLVLTAIIPVLSLKDIK
jgi:MFS family permease